MPKVSIIIPVYNVCDYLSDCIDSIKASLNQVGGADKVEAVFVDDGSTDGSSEILDDFAQCYDWVKVFHHSNQGVAAARNFALGKVCGEYLAWIDPDDMVEIDYFRSIFNALDVSPDVILFDYENRPGGVCHYRYTGGSLPIEMVWGDLVRDERLKSFLCCKVVRRKLVPVPLFNESCMVMSDFEAMWRIFKEAKTVEYIHKSIYIYRQRVGSIVNQPIPSRMMQMFQLALKRKEEVDDIYGKDALSCAMYHAYHYCHMAAKFPSDGWNEGGQLDKCRCFVRNNLLDGLIDRKNGIWRKVQFVIVATGLMRVAVYVRRLLPGGRV